jgi:hypothetical protein
LLVEVGGLVLAWPDLVQRTGLKRKGPGGSFNAAEVSVPPIGPIESINPAAQQIAITVAAGERPNWDGYGFGLGKPAEAFAARDLYTSFAATLFDDLDTKVIRLHNPQEAGFVANCKPVVDLALSKGVDRILATGYVWRAVNEGSTNYSPTSLANFTASAIAGGIPITHVCLQNEPDSNAPNYPPNGIAVDLVPDHIELRNRLDALGLSAVEIIGLEWAHFGGSGEDEYDRLNAAGLIPGTVGLGAGHCYKDCPANGLYDSRWLTKGLPLWSTETGNAGSPNCQARFVAALNHGAAVEIHHIGLSLGTRGDTSQFLMLGNGETQLYYGGVRVISEAIPRGTVFRLCRSSDRPEGLSTTFADRMIRNGGRFNPRIQVAAGRKSDDRWVIVAVNATEGTEDKGSSFLGAHYASATLQITTTVAEMAGQARVFKTRRASQTGTITTSATKNMQDGVIRFTLVAGETIALEEA